MVAPLTFTLDLKSGTHTLPSSDFVSFESALADSNNDGYLETVLKINLNDPNLSNPYDRVAFDITYDSPSIDFSVNIGDSRTNNGQAGDAGTQSNDAELQIRDDAFTVYANDFAGSGSLQSISNFTSGPSTVNFEVANEFVEWNNNSGIADNLSSSGLYALDGQADIEGPVNYDIFAAFNRVIANDLSRRGSGVSTVTVTLIDDEELTPTPGDDDLTYTAADEIIDALAGNDLIRARAGNDEVFGNDGDDSLRGNRGDDTLIGGAGNDRLLGQLGDDVLIGVDEESLASPGAGEQDVLTGGDGADEFVLGNEAGSFYDDDATTIAEGRAGRAVVRDFTSGEDQIILHGTAASYELRETQAGHTVIFETTGSVRDLIGVVRNTTGLDLSDSDTFTFASLEI